VVIYKASFLIDGYIVDNPAAEVKALYELICSLFTEREE
jgi:hypothetical protein